MPVSYTPADSHSQLLATVLRTRIPHGSCSRAKETAVRLLLCGLFVFLARPMLAGEQVTVASLQCERQVEPVGIDRREPAFNWQLQSSRRGVKQTAYQLRVASSREQLVRGKPDLWDSGRTLSDQCCYIRYAGKPLESSQRYYWDVRVWDDHDSAAAWSDAASFVTGLLDADQWQAKWITMDRTDQDPLPLFRRSVNIAQPITHAVVHICGLGQYELRINGQRVGNRQMDPGWTNYRKTCLYSSYDVTAQLTTGENVLGVMLGNGMYNVPGGRYVKFNGSFGPPKLICQLHITCADGTTRVIHSDDTWKCTAGPITFSCIYGGEDFDARRVLPRWDNTGFDDQAWSSATVCDGPGGRLVAQTAPPIEVADTLQAVTIKRLADGRHEVDCGINLSARPWIKVRGRQGDQVTVTCAEQRGKPWPGHSYTFTLNGSGEETFGVRFTYFSFQYLYITGVARPNEGDGVSTLPLLLEAGSEFLTSSATHCGTFHCSHSLLNDIDAMITRSVRSNLQCVLTDCPHREKLGWLEVSHLMGPSILYRFDAQRLYRKICRDTTESQLDNGLVPDIAPEYTRFQDGFFESAEWGSASVQLPWLLYRWYGDREVLEWQYDTMAQYVRYLASTCDPQGLAKPGLGDWYDWTPQAGHVGASQLTPPELPATAMLYDNARIMAQTAALLGRKKDSAEFEELANKVRLDFQTAYYDPATNSVATNSQAALATALYYQLAPQNDRTAVFAKLVSELQRNQFRQTTGEVCFRMLVQTLADEGRSDVIFQMLNRTDAPGYGHMLQLGFKTLSERWDKPGSSMNHCMFGQAQEWFQKSVLGIQQAPDSVGFQRIVLRPEPVGELDAAAGSFDSIYGRIESDWSIKNGQFHWRVVVPPNTSAEVHVPTADASQVREGEELARDADHVQWLRSEPAVAPGAGGSRAVFVISSGTYDFHCPHPSKN